MENRTADPTRIVLKTRRDTESMIPAYCTSVARNIYRRKITYHILSRCLVEARLEFLYATATHSRTKYPIYSRSNAPTFMDNSTPHVLDIGIYRLHGGKRLISHLDIGIQIIHSFVDACGMDRGAFSTIHSPSSTSAQRMDSTVSPLHLCCEGSWGKPRKTWGRPGKICTLVRTLQIKYEIVSGLLPANKPTLSRSWLFRFNTQER